MQGKIAYQCKEDGTFSHEVQAQPSPREPGVWLLPKYATWEAPPSKKGKQAIYDFDRQEWVLVKAEKSEAQGFTWPRLDIPAKKAGVALEIKRRLGECEEAMKEILWSEWAGEPHVADLKLKWANYRKELKAIDLDALDEKFWTNMKKVENFPWPELP